MDMDMSGLLDRAQNWIERKTSGLFGQAPVIPRTERNMNPLAVNLKNNKRRIYWDGERVIQNDRQLRNETSPMSQFRNEAMGMRAGVRNFKTQVGRAMQANQSMTDLMHTYHGTTKQRAHSKNYARHILKKIGNNADPDQVLVSSIDFNNPDTMYNIVQGIASWEGGPKASFDENLVKYGIDLERPEAAGDFSAWQFGGENAPEQTVQQAYEGMAVANELFNQQLGQDVKPPLKSKPIASKPNNDTGFNYQAPAYGTDKPQGVRGGQPTVVRQPNGNQAVNYQTASFQPEQMAPQPLQEPAYGRSGGIYSPQQMAEMVAYSQKLAKAQGLGLGTKI